MIQQLTLDAIRAESALSENRRGPLKDPERGLLILMEVAGGLAAAIQAITRPLGYTEDTRMNAVREAIQVASVAAQLIELLERCKQEPNHRPAGGR